MAQCHIPKKLYGPIESYLSGQPQRDTPQTKTLQQVVVHHAPVGMKQTFFKPRKPVIVTTSIERLHVSTARACAPGFPIKVSNVTPAIVERATQIIRTTTEWNVQFSNRPAGSQDQHINLNICQENLSGNAIGYLRIDHIQDGQSVVGHICISQSYLEGCHDEKSLLSLILHEIMHGLNINHWEESCLSSITNETK